MAHFILLLAAVFVHLVRAQDGCDDLRATYYRIASNSQQTGRRSLTVDGAAGDDSSGCTVCRTLQGALEQGGSDNLTIRVTGGTLQLSSPLNITEISGLAIIGDSELTTSIRCAPPSTAANASSSIIVQGSRDVYFANITFEGCGVNTPIVVLSQSDSVVFESCIFTNSLAPAVVINNSAFVSFVSSKFANNQEAFNCPPSLQSTPLMLLVENSSFFNNSLPSESLYGGRGGAIRIDVESSAASKVCIVRSVFDSNSAPVSGGAVYLSLTSISNETEVSIISSTFTNNSCNVCGGAIHLDVNTVFKAVNITGTNFSGNNASVGGALSIVASVGRPDQRVNIKKSLFTKNAGTYDGTAFAVISLTGTNEVGLPVGVEDCDFSFNSPFKGASYSSTAILVSQSLVAFGGFNNVSCNAGGGLALYGSRMDLRGTVIFFKNYAESGGGAYLTGKSLILLYEGSALTFDSNRALQYGGGLHVVTTASLSLFPVRNKNCFIQWFNPSNTDIPPSRWNATVSFYNNWAGVMGAAIFASDFTQCGWFGSDNVSTDLISRDSISRYIFTSSNSTKWPFQLSGNQIDQSVSNKNWFATESLGSEAFFLDVVVSVNGRTINRIIDVASGEIVTLVIHTYDQFRNKRPAIWTAKLPYNESMRLGSTSAEGGSLLYTIPPLKDANSSHMLSVVMGLNGIGDSSTNITFVHRANCHPGFENGSNSICKCKQDGKIVLRCDENNRYIYIKPGLWVNYTAENVLYSGRTISWYIGCTTGKLPGCLFLFDDVDAQCAPNRRGILCSQCKEGYGVTLDLLSCEGNCGVNGPGLYIYIILYCIGVPVLTFLILYFDVKVPNELKGFIFYAQVIGFIYRDSDRQNNNINEVLSILYNILGFTTAFPFCLFEGLSAITVAFLGIVPYILALFAMLLYLLCAYRVRSVGKRDHYGYHGFYFIFLFMYKYFLDFGFILVSCQNVKTIGTVHLYSGNACFDSPYAFFFAGGIIIITLFAVGVPIYVLYLMYRQKKVIHVFNAISFGLKEGKMYAWYGVWDIWRRIPFAAMTTVMIGANSTLFTYTLLILFIVLVIIIVKPYKDEHVNVIELLIILCLFVATVTELDDTAVYVSDEFGKTFSLLPYFYVIFYIFWRAFTYIGACNFCKNIFANKDNPGMKPSISPDDSAKDGTEYQLHDLVYNPDNENCVKPREPLLESCSETRCMKKRSTTNSFASREEF